MMTTDEYKADAESRKHLLSAPSREEDAHREIARLKDTIGDLRHACQMALDSYTMDGNQYEQKYWPEAGPMTLVAILERVLKQSSRADS